MADGSDPVSDSKDKKQVLDEPVREVVRSSAYAGGRWAVFISFIALIISAFSLYETTLKQAKPAIHVGGVIQYARDTLQPADVFIVPVTITNFGARDMIIRELDLRVAKADSVAPAWIEMTGLYNGSNPRQEKTLFTPISVPGGSARTANILFYRDSAAGGAPDAIVTGNEEFRFCLTSQLAVSEDFTIFGVPAPPHALFQAEVTAFGKEELIAGRTVALRVRNVKASDAGKSVTEAAPEC